MVYVSDLGLDLSVYLKKNDVFNKIFLIIL